MVGSDGFFQWDGGPPRRVRRRRVTNGRHHGTSATMIFHEECAWQPMTGRVGFSDGFSSRKSGGLASVPPSNPLEDCDRMHKVREKNQSPNRGQAHRDWPGSRRTPRQAARSVSENRFAEWILTVLGCARFLGHRHAIPSICRIYRSFTDTLGPLSIRSWK